MDVPSGGSIDYYGNIFDASGLYTGTDYYQSTAWNTTQAAARVDLAAAKQVQDALAAEDAGTGTLAQVQAASAARTQSFNHVIDVETIVNSHGGTGGPNTLPVTAATAGTGAGSTDSVLSTILTPPTPTGTEGTPVKQTGGVTVGSAPKRKVGFIALAVIVALMLL